MSKLEMIAPQELHAHEAVSEERIGHIAALLRKNGKFYPPLLVDAETRVVLDGHHRLRASLELGCKRVPCYCVDYLNDDSVLLESWRPDVSLSKRQVIEMGLSDTVFPLKTTRHRYAIPDTIEPVPLVELTNGE